MVKDKINNGKILYKSKIEYTYEEYYKLFECKKYPFVFFAFLCSFIIFIIVCVLFTLVSKDISRNQFIIIYMLFAVLGYLGYKMNYANTIYKFYLGTIKDKKDKELYINFYDNFFIVNKKTEVYYDSITRMIETKDNIYLNDKNNVCFVVVKNENNDGISLFLKDKCKNAKYAFKNKNIKIKYPNNYKK